MTVSFAVWMVSPGYAGLVVFALLLGIGYGGFVALGPPLAARTTTSRRSSTARRR